MRVTNAEDRLFVTYDKLKINGELYELKLNGQQEELMKVEQVQKNGEGRRQGQSFDRGVGS